MLNKGTCSCFKKLYFLSQSPPCPLCVRVREWRRNLLSSIPANGQRVHCQHVDLGYYIYCVYIPHPLLHKLPCTHTVHIHAYYIQYVVLSCNCKRQHRSVPLYIYSPITHYCCDVWLHGDFYNWTWPAFPQLEKTVCWAALCRVYYEKISLVEHVQNILAQSSLLDLLEVVSTDWVGASCVPLASKLMRQMNKMVTCKCAGLADGYLHVSAPIFWWKAVLYLSFLCAVNAAL